MTGTWFDGALVVHAKGFASRFDPSTGAIEDLPAVPGMYLAGLVATTDDLWAIGPSDDDPDTISVARHDGSGWEAVRTHEVPEGGAGVLGALRRLETDAVVASGEIVVWSRADGGLDRDAADLLGRRRDRLRVGGEVCAAHLNRVSRPEAAPPSSSWVAARRSRVPGRHPSATGAG